MKPTTLEFLYLLLIPVVLLNLLSHMFWGLLIRFKSILIKSKPDSTLLDNTLNKEVSLNQSITSIQPVPSIGNYLGHNFHCRIYSRSNFDHANHYNKHV